MFGVRSGTVTMNNGDAALLTIDDEAELDSIAISASGKPKS